MTEHNFHIRRNSFPAIFLSAVLLLLLACCSRNSEMEGRLDAATEIMVSSPDSALSILRDIPVDRLDSKALKARHALLLSQALDKNYVDTTDFSILQPAIDFYIDGNNGSDDDKLRTLYYQARIYQNMGDNDNAMRAFVLGKEFENSFTDTLTMANLLVAQGIIYYETYNSSEYIRNNLKAANLYDPTRYPAHRMRCLTNVINGSLVEENKQLADSIFPIAQELLDRHPELNYFLTPYIVSYAIYFGPPEDIKNTLQFIEEFDDLSDETKLDMAIGYCKIKEPIEAKRLIDSLNEKTVSNKSKYYLAKTDIAELMGAYDEAFNSFNSYYELIDAQHLQMFKEDLLFAQEKHDLIVKNLIQVQKRDKIIWISLICLLALLSATLFFFNRYRMSQANRKLAEKENANLLLSKENLQNLNKKLELEKDKANLECQKKSLESENMRLKIEQLESESENLKELLENQSNLGKPVEDAIRVRIEMLNGLLATRISENDSYSKAYSEWRDAIVNDKNEFMNTTRLAFKASHPKFIQYLEDHHLTIDEINYLCLYAIGLKGKEVGEYIKLKRHYHISSEIRKKLGIDEHETNIGIYVRKLLKNG